MTNVSFINIGSNSGLNVVEVAHDMSLPVAKYITEALKLTNSYDTWHGERFIFVCINYVYFLYRRNKKRQQRAAKNHQRY